MMFVWSSGSEIPGCSHCGSEVPVCEFKDKGYLYPKGTIPEEGYAFCKFCLYSFASNLTIYKGGGYDAGVINLSKIISQQNNLMLEEIRQLLR